MMKTPVVKTARGSAAGGFEAGLWCEDATWLDSGPGKEKWLGPQEALTNPPEARMGAE
jgi:hypothetical protein